MDEQNLVGVLERFGDWSRSSPQLELALYRLERQVPDRYQICLGNQGGVRKLVI